MEVNKNNIRKALTTKIEKQRLIRSLAYRAAAILRHSGHTFSTGVWRYYDALLLHEINDTAIRRATLRRVFSIRGSRIKVEDEEIIQTLERKLGMG